MTEMKKLRNISVVILQFGEKIKANRDQTSLSFVLKSNKVYLCQIVKYNDIVTNIHCGREGTKILL